MASCSSSIGRAVFHIGFKVKYCHGVFAFDNVRNRCKEIFEQVASVNKITIYKIGFGDGHVHFEADIGLKSIPEIAKLFKGTSGYFLLKEFSHLKKKYFWVPVSGARSCISIQPGRIMKRYQITSLHRNTTSL